MINTKIIFNTLLVFFAVSIVLFLRIQTALISYDVALDFKTNKTKNTQMNLLTAKYLEESGAESMVMRSNNIVALSAPKSDQVVMVNKRGFVLTK